MQKAIDAINGGNPLVLYGQTYAMHEYFDAAGLFENGVHEIAQGYRGKPRLTSYRFYKNDTPLRYRVNHGGYITQHTWRNGQHACWIEDIRA